MIADRKMVIRTPSKNMMWHVHRLEMAYPPAFERKRNDVWLKVIEYLSWMLCKFDPVALSLMPMAANDKHRKTILIAQLVCDGSYASFTVCFSTLDSLMVSVSGKDTLTVLSLLFALRDCLK